MLAHPAVLTWCNLLKRKPIRGLLEEFNRRFEEPEKQSKDALSRRGRSKNGLTAGRAPGSTRDTCYVSKLYNFTVREQYN